MNTTATNHLLLLQSLNHEPSTKRPSTVVVRLFDDGTFDIEQFHTEPGEHSVYGLKHKQVRYIDSCTLFTLDNCLKKIKKQKYATVKHRTPQSYRIEIADLKKEIKQLKARLKNWETISNQFNLKVETKPKR